MGYVLRDLGVEMIRGMCISSNESALGAFGNYLINSVVVFLSLPFSKQTLRRYVVGSDTYEPLATLLLCE